MNTERTKLYEYLINNDYEMNSGDVLVYHEPDEYFCKDNIVVLFFSNKTILIKDISNNRRYNFDSNQSTKVIIGFLKYLEKSFNKILA